MSKKIIVHFAEKGGVGKSIIAENFTSAALLGEDLERINKVILYEFDAHHFSYDRIKNDKNIEGVSVSSSPEEIEQAVAEIEWEAEENHIIIDVGGGDNTDRFLSALSNKSIAKSMIFVVPESNEKPTSAADTILKIRSEFPDAKILLTLNKHLDSQRKEDQFIFVFGSDKYGIKPSLLLEEDNVEIVTLPECSTLLALCSLENVSIWTKAQEHKAFSNLTISEKKAIWGIEEQRLNKGSDLTPEEEKKATCSKPYFIKRTVSLNASIYAQSVLEKASIFSRTLLED